MRCPDRCGRTAALLLLLLAVLVAVEAGQDHYRVLGVSRTATDAHVKVRRCLQGNSSAGMWHVGPTRHCTKFALSVEYVQGGDHVRSWRPTAPPICAAQAAYRALAIKYHPDKVLRRPCIFPDQSTSVVTELV